MPKFPVLKPKEVIKRFEKLGFIIDRKWNQLR
jgi:predicted RNA binding protein YcfA (HicA-like mRNA interferase family)